MSNRTLKLPRARTAVSLAAAAALTLPASFAVADAAGPSSSSTKTAVAAPHQTATAAKAKPRFPGHRPGRIYLGMSCGVNCGQKVPQLGRSFGIQRWFKKWGNWNGVAKAIEENRRAHRLPWISIEGPQGGDANGWRDVGRGRYDRDIRALAKVLKQHDNGPTFISFDHEPSNKALDSQGGWWARGYIHFYDELKRAHALKHVAVPPIMASWMFSKFNHEDTPRKWLTAGVLRRAPFLAIDVYQNEKDSTYGKRLPAISRWLGNHGHPHMMLGIGETGSTDYYRNTTAVKWLNNSLRWASHHPGRVAAISYFNSTAYSRDGAYWPLDESRRKMRAYRHWLTNPRYIARVR